MRVLGLVEEDVQQSEDLHSAGASEIIFIRYAI